jgi:Glutathione S-transferase, N-terminal domain
MRLLYQTHSPFARKVLVMAHETGLADRIEVIHHETSPVRRNAAVYDLNPLGKVPVLVCEGGVALFDSAADPDAGHRDRRGSRLIPESGRVRWLALRLEALAEGMAEAGSAHCWDTARRPEKLRWPAMADGQAPSCGTPMTSSSRTSTSAGRWISARSRWQRRSTGSRSAGSPGWRIAIAGWRHGIALSPSGLRWRRRPCRARPTTARSCGQSGGIVARSWALGWFKRFPTDPFGGKPSCRLVNGKEAFDPDFLDRDVLRRPERCDRREDIERNARLPQVDGKQWAGRILHGGGMQECR